MAMALAWAQAQPQQAQPQPQDGAPRPPQQAGWAGVLALLATVNIFLGLINLAPILPFDGGHIAVATYEEIRTRISGKAYRVNMAKLMPVTYIVVLLMVGLFASTLYLDAVDPVKLSP